MNYVLHEQSSSPDIPLIVEFRKAYGELQDQIAKAKERLQQVTAAIAAHSPLEMALGQKKKELAAAEADLGKMAQSLGNAAFHAFLAGKIAELPVFAERLDLHRKIADMESEKLSLAAPENAGMFQKTTAKGQQLIVVGKIKLAAMKEGSLETALGRNLLHTNQEELVCCDQTSSVLDAIRKQRSLIAVLRDQVSEAQLALDFKRKELCESLGLEKIEGKSTFDAELSKCEEVIHQKEKERLELEARLPDRLLGEPNIPQEGRLAEMLGDLRLAAPSQPADGHRSDSRHQFALPFFPPRPPGTSNRNYYISVVSRTRIVPLAVCTLGLGWVLSYVTPERFFLPTWTVLIPIALLAAPALVLAVLSGVFFVRPNDVEFEPTKRCILALTFTMTAGLVLLLVFYKIADLELHTHGFRTGGVPRLYEAFVKFIGWSYENVDSSSLVTRLIANIFSFGLCEEITKLLPLFYFAAQEEQQHTCEFLNISWLLVDRLLLRPRVWNW